VIIPLNIFQKISQFHNLEFKDLQQAFWVLHSEDSLLNLLCKTGFVKDKRKTEDHKESKSFTLIRYFRHIRVGGNINFGTSCYWHSNDVFFFL